MNSTKEYSYLEPGDDGLLGSLHNIMDALETIWVPNVYIIKDFTDHGRSHSDRVLKNAAFLLKILKNNSGRDLSEVERYLLLVSIYLHDIGMQCDLAKFPHMIEIAEKLGADFEGMVFDAEFSSTYTTEAQIQIRNNHQFLTAAWIKRAFENRGNYEESGLDYPAKSIPVLLVQNLMDICMYHSGPTERRILNPCQFDRNTRIPLLAALLRFADELDTDRYRVCKPENFHKNFRLPLDNIKHWWLNGRTHISPSHEFTNGKNSGKIIIDVFLHPEDLEEFGSLLQEKIIEEFKRKNNATLTVLEKYEIPITISEDSKISENEYLERIPGRILEELTRKR